MAKRKREPERTWPAQYTCVIGDTLSDALKRAAIVAKSAERLGHAVEHVTANLAYDGGELAHVEVTLYWHDSDTRLDLTGLERKAILG